MTVTESFLLQIKKYVPRVSPAEWKLFTTMAQKQHSGSLYRLTKSLANCLHGKKSSKSAYAELSRLSMGFVLAQQVSGSLAATFRKKLTHLLEHDLALPKIQRVFPDFVGNPAEYFEIVNQLPYTVGLFLALLSVTDWPKHEDLVSDVMGIARSIESLRIQKNAQFVYKKVSSNKEFLTSDLEGLILLRGLAEKHQLVATLRSLPPTPTSRSGNKISINQEIVGAIMRFPVREELEIMEHRTRRQLESFLSDLVDFFQDYPIGEVRRQGLRDFPRRCHAYVKLGNRS